MNEKEYGRLSLLDIMADSAQLDYLSDLRFMIGEQYKDLSLKLQDIPPEAYPLRDWNAAIRYLSQAPPAENAETAKARLIAALKKLG